MNDWQEGPSDGGPQGEETDTRARKLLATRRSRAVLVGFAVVLGLASMPPTTAGAATRPVPGALGVAALADQAPPTSIPFTRIGTKWVANGSPASSSAYDTSMITTTDGTTSVGIRPGSSVTWTQGTGGTLQSIDQGRTRIVTAFPDALEFTVVIPSATTIHTQPFDMSLPSGAELVKPEEGDQIDLIDVEGVPIDATVGFPVGTDADGDPFTMRMNVKDPDTFVIEAPENEGLTYPLTARYVFKWGYISGTAYFDIPETIDIASAGSATAVCGLLAVGGRAGAIFAALCAATWGVIVTRANQAKNAEQCLKIKINVVGPYTPNLVPGKYNSWGQGYCHK